MLEIGANRAVDLIMTKEAGGGRGGARGLGPGAQRWAGAGEGAQARGAAGLEGEVCAPVAGVSGRRGGGIVSE